VKRALSLGELADACRIDRDELIRTVERFNRYAQAGIDAEFQRGDDSYRVFNGLRSNKPNPCLAPDRLRALLRRQDADRRTRNFQRTDHKCRLLDKNWRIIPGLYAAGSDAANFMAGTCPGSGINIGSAVVFGYILGQHAS
jgi:predicted oxidoreductase